MNLLVLSSNFIFSCLDIVATSQQIPFKSNFYFSLKADLNNIAPLCVSYWAIIIFLSQEQKLIFIFSHNKKVTKYYIR